VRTTPNSQPTLRAQPGNDNIFRDIGFARDEAESLRLRAQLMSHLRELARSMTRRKAATRFGVPQRRLSDLLRGKIGAFSVDALVKMLGHARMRVELRVTKSA
jgi:predicted XRE-type DNA-binding protein